MDASKSDATETAADRRRIEPDRVEPDAGGGGGSPDNMAEELMLCMERGQAHRVRVDKRFVALVANAAMKMHERAVMEAELNRPPGPKPTELHKQLREFVDRVIFEVLILCGAVIGCRPVDCVGHVGRLAERVMSGLPEAPPPHMHACQRVAESVIRKIQRKFNRKVLRYILLSPDPSAQALVVHCFQSRITKHMVQSEPGAA